MRGLPQKLGTISGVRFENLQVWTDSDAIKPIIYVQDTPYVTDVAVCGLFVNGELQEDFSRFDLQIGADDFHKIWRKK